MKKRDPLLLLTAAIMACATTVKADAPMSGMSSTNSPISDSDRIKALEQKVEELEGKLDGNAAMTGGTNDASKTLNWWSQNQVSGFASASYLHNFNSQLPATGRSFDVNDGFSLNKLKLVLQNPAAASPDKWVAGYRADVIVGQDAKLIQSAGLGIGDYIDLEQLYGTINVPI